MKAYITELVRRARLAVSWLVEQVDDDGYLIPAEGDIGCYYKCVYALRLTGYSVEAAKVLGRIMELHYTDTGDLRNSPERKSSGTYTSYFCQVYPNMWITLGAHLLGRYDVVRMLMTGIMNNYYDEELGTFRSSCRPRLEQFDVNSGAAAVELFVLTDIEKAKRAGDFLIRHIENQPDPQKWYYTRLEKPWTYLTTPDPRSAPYSAMELDQENQAYWCLGLPSAALAQLYECTGEAKYLEGAERFFETFLARGENGCRAPGSGKSFWASSILYRLTGEQKYLETNKKLGEFFFSCQQEDGTFVMPDMKPEEITPKWLFDSNPEYLRWFLEVAAELTAAEQAS